MIDIADWMDDHLTGAKHNVGAEWTAICPFCGRQGKFYVNTESGRWICFSGKCGERGKQIWSLVAKVEGISVAQARAQAVRDGITFRRRKSTPLSLAQRLLALRGELDVSEDEQVRADLPAGFVPVYDPSRKKKWRMPVYMKKRGFKRSTMKQFGVGYTEAGEFVEVPGTDRHIYVGQRLFIPVVSPTGYSWTARDIRGDQRPKYLNAPNADHRRLIFGWDQVALESDVAIQEGPTDVMMSHQHGMPALGLMGKVLNREQLRLLFRKPVTCSFVIMLDPDAEADAHAIGLQLAVRFPDVFIARLPEDADPGSASREVLWRAYDDAPRFKGNRASGLAARLARAASARS
jgi:DNA primase